MPEPWIDNGVPLTDEQESLRARALEFFDEALLARASDPTTAAELARRGLAVVISTGDYDTRAKLHTVLADARRNQGDLDGAFNALVGALDDFTFGGDVGQQVEELAILARVADEGGHEFVADALRGASDAAEDQAPMVTLDTKIREGIQAGASLPQLLRLMQVQAVLLRHTVLYDDYAAQLAQVAEVYRLLGHDGEAALVRNAAGAVATLAAVARTGGSDAAEW